MKRSDRSSLCRVILVFFFCVYLKNVFCFVTGFLYLLFTGKKEILYTLTCFIILLTVRTIPPLTVPYAIVDHPSGKGYQCASLLYKVLVYSEEELHPGDILVLSDLSPLEDEKRNSELVLYSSGNAVQIASFGLRKTIYDLIGSFPEELRSFLRYFFYHYDDYGSDELSGLFLFSAYVFLREISGKNGFLSVLLMVSFSIAFCFQIRFLLIVLNLLLNKTKLTPTDRIAVSAFILYLIHPCLLRNTGILLSLTYRFSFAVDTGLSGSTVLCLIQSFFFSEIRLWTLLFYQKVRKLSSVILVACIVLIVFPDLSPLYLSVFRILAKGKEILDVLSVRGQVNILYIAVFLFLKRFFKISIGRIETVFCIFLFLLPFHHPFCEVSFLDVGQGDAILLRSYLGRENILIDTGSVYNYSKVKKALFSRGIYQIDTLIITHDDSDHNGNRERLLRDFKVSEVVEEGRDIQGKDFILKYLYLGTYPDDNDNSLVYCGRINGLDFLFTGDISEKAERELIQRYGDIETDVLKVSHHGSYTGTSEYFVSKLLPDCAVISTSGMYGHPHRSVLETLEKYGVHVFITKDDGEISFLFTRYFTLIRDRKGWYNVGV